MPRQILIAVSTLLMWAAGVAGAAEVETSFCGYLSYIDPELQALVDSTPGVDMGLGDRFVATVTTDNAADGPGTCSKTLPDDCGSIVADASGNVAAGTLSHINGSSANDWSAEGTVSFDFGGMAASASVETDVVGPRTPGTIDPSFTRVLTGVASVDLVVNDVAYPIQATIVRMNDDCRQGIPTLPVWGIPALATGMLTSAILILRKRASAS